MQSLLTGIFHRRLEIQYEILLTFFIILLGANVFLHSYVNPHLLCFSFEFLRCASLCFSFALPRFDSQRISFSQPLRALLFLCISPLDVANLHHFNAAQLKTLPFLAMPFHRVTTQSVSPPSRCRSNRCYTLAFRSIDVLHRCCSHRYRALPLHSMARPHLAFP